MCCFSPECVDCQAGRDLRCVHDHIRRHPPLSGHPGRSGRRRRSRPPSSAARSRPTAIARFGDGDFADAEAALAAYDDAAAAVADDLHQQGGRRRGRGRGGADRERRAGPRQGAALGRSSKNLQTGQGPVAAVQGAVEQFVTIFTNMGGLMAERVTDLRDIERRVIAHLVGEPAAGRAHADRAVGARGRGPRAERHLRPRPGAGHRARHRARRRDQPHRDHRPPARHPLRRRRRRRDGRSRPGRFVVVDGETGTIELGADPDEAAAAGRGEPRGRAPPWPRGPVPPRRPTGIPVKLLANVADGASAARPPSEPVAGGRALPHRAVLPQPPATSRRPRSRPTIYCAGPRRLRRRPRTSSYAPSTPGRTSRSPSPRTRARRTLRSASAACGCPSATPA